MKRKMIEAATAYIAGLFFASFFTDLALLFVSAAIMTAVIVGIRYGFKEVDSIIMVVCFTVAISVFFLDDTEKVNLTDLAIKYGKAAKTGDSLSSNMISLYEQNNFEILLS